MMRQNVASSPTKSGVTTEKLFEDFLNNIHVKKLFLIFIAKLRWMGDNGLHISRKNCSWPH
jgi:hypothetical protein